MTKTIKRLFPKPPWLSTSYRHKCPNYDCFLSQSRAVWRFGPTNSDSHHVLQDLGPSTARTRLPATQGWILGVSLKFAPILSFMVIKILVSHSSKNRKRLKPWWKGFTLQETITYPTKREVRKIISSKVPFTRIVSPFHPLRFGRFHNFGSDAWWKVADVNPPKSICCREGII